MRADIGRAKCDVAAEKCADVGASGDVVRVATKVLEIGGRGGRLFFGFLRTLLSTGDA